MQPECGLWVNDYSTFDDKKDEECWGLPPPRVLFLFTCFSPSDASLGTYNMGLSRGWELVNWKLTDCSILSSHKGYGTDMKAYYDKIHRLMTSLFLHTFMLMETHERSVWGSCWPPLCDKDRVASLSHFVHCAETSPPVCELSLSAN